MNEFQKPTTQLEMTGTSFSSQRSPVTLDSILDMRFPDDVTISSDGKRVAFVVWEKVPDEQKRRGRIWVADTSSGEAHPFTKGKRGETCPRWSPDGTRLAFITQLEGEKEKPQLHLMSADGGEAHCSVKCQMGSAIFRGHLMEAALPFSPLKAMNPKAIPKSLAPVAIVVYGLFIPIPLSLNL